MRGVLVVCGALLAVAVVLPGRAEGQADAPNVLLIVTDDQRATNTLRAMPKTRSAFARGTTYTNAFATTPLCCPSRATILTGRYAHNTGVKRQSSRPLDPTTLFPRLLQQAGYRAALAGKFLLGWPGEAAPPFFDRWAMICNCTRASPFTFNVDGATRTVFGHSNNLIGTYATRFLRSFEEDDAAPWFLYAAPIDPHSPWTPPPKYANVKFPLWQGNPAVFERNRSDKPGFVRLKGRRGLGRAQQVRTGQLRELKSIDDMVGRLVARLKDFGELADTLLIFTSDNGLLWSEHGIGGKRLPYPASARVPLLVRRPNQRAANVVKRLVGNVDISPTVLDVAEVLPDPTKPPLDGRSLFDPTPRGRILLENWRGRDIPTWASIRTRTYQYTEYYVRNGPATTFREYYDLRSDPWQLENLFRDGDPTNDPDVSKIRARLARDRGCAGANGPFACP